ncbi:MAG TPA: type II secretion system protein GspM [Verrucomicrobiae bacterium]|nr:type II secretion system protein GspM [Verrucomicrobiae bacterium]
MRKYLSQLRPLERRLVVGGVVVLIVVLNWWFVWGHFSDWSHLRRELDDAQHKLNRYHDAVAQIPDLQKKVGAFESQGASVPPEDQAINFTRTIQSQSSASSVNIVNTSRQVTRTNDAFFVEQIQNIVVTANDEQLVDFLYKLGSDASMIRVPDLELQPDAAHHSLTASIRLIASYQRNPTAPAGSKSATAKTK